ncbi:MAG TPA: alpha/beta fold hydrolase [Nannocystis sp.]|jgi:pimeloyl-ACP methyl ester carboxylesterase
MHVHREGPEHARTSVLLLHAGASSGAQWTGYARALGPDVRTLAPDLHGHGETPLPADITVTGAIDRMVDDLLEVPGADRFHLVGHSFGGLLALALALRMPARVRSLTVVEPACFDALRVGGPRALHEESSHEVEHLTALITRGDHEQAMQLVVARWGMGRWELFTPQQRAQFVALAPALLGIGLVAAWRWRCEPAELARLAGIPTVLVHGEHSPAVAFHVSENLCGLIPGARRECIAGAGHMLPLTHRAALRRLLQRQLEPGA